MNDQAAGSKRAFTLIELLVVIAIIGILAAMIVPAVAIAKRRGQETRARHEIADLVNAIQRYYTTYNRYPASQKAMESILPPNPVPAGSDFTYGGTFPGDVTVRAPGAYQSTNDEVIAILMDFTNYPGQPTLLTANQDHIKNPQRIPFLNAKLADAEGQPGVGPDLVYRDPWGNPYVISMDLNYDDRVRDALYGRPAVSQGSGGVGLHGLVRNELPGGIMVWSAGFDRQVATNMPGGVNSDNILSWK